MTILPSESCCYIHVGTADVHAEHAGWSAGGSDGRAINRAGPSVAAVLLGHGAGDLQPVDTTLLPADNASHGGGRRAVQPRGYHDQRTDTVRHARTYANNTHARKHACMLVAEWPS